MTSATVSTMLAAAAETEVHNDIGNPILWGVGAFVILMLLLLGTLTFGRGRT